MNQIECGERHPPQGLSSRGDAVRGPVHSGDPVGAPRPQPNESDRRRAVRALPGRAGCFDLRGVLRSAEDASEQLLRR